jgi:hypothetical protein
MTPVPHGVISTSEGPVEPTEFAEAVLELDDEKLVEAIEEELPEATEEE